jgi:hypothetical protein
MNPNLPSSSNKNLPSGFLNLSKIEQNNVKKKNSPAFKIFRLKAGLFRVQSNRKNNTRGRIKPVSRFLLPWESQSFQPARDL